ncbi:unnamed protein product, partial [Adineta ricciae]
MDTNDVDIDISLPEATDQQKTSIEDFIMDHACSIKHLFTLLSYTPKVRHLKFLNPIDAENFNTIEQPIQLKNLTKFSMDIYRMTFDEFEQFMKKFASNLTNLSLNIQHEDMSYLNAKRWENFLRANLPQLDKFYLKKTVYFADDYPTPMYLGEQNEFSSTYWLEKRWIFKVENDFENLIYSIKPYKKNWFEYNSKSNQLSNCVQFEIQDLSLEKWVKTITINEHILHALSVTQIYHLEISLAISFEDLHRILLLLPDIETLSLFRLEFLDPQYISDEEIQLLCSLLHRDRLKKLS